MKLVNPFGCALLALACGSSFEPNYNPPALFTNPTVITNAHLPLGTLTQDVLEGVEGGKSSLVIRTRLPGTRAFTVNGAQVLAIIVSDTVYTAGAVTEVALDYFVQSDNGDVYYFGEDVDEYANGQIVSHEGTWHLGVDTNKPGLFLPATPKVGDKFRSEDVPGITTENDEVIAVDETVTVTAGTYQHCVKVKEILSDGAVEYKLYAPGVGVVREVPEDGLVDLKTHT